MIDMKPPAKVPAISEMFTAFLQEPIAKSIDLPRKPDGSISAVSVAGTEEIGTYMAVIAAQESGTAIAIEPSDPDFPLVVLVLTPAPRHPDGDICEVAPQTSFDMLLIGEEYTCDQFEWDGDCYDCDVVWPFGWWARLSSFEGEMATDPPSVSRPSESSTLNKGRKSPNLR